MTDIIENGTNTIADVCPICDRHCPVSSPGCGRGRRYAMQNNNIDGGSDGACWKNKGQHPHGVDGMDDMAEGRRWKHHGHEGHGDDSMDDMAESHRWKHHRHDGHGNDGMDDMVEGRGWKHHGHHGHEGHGDNDEHILRHGRMEGRDYSDPDAGNDLGNMLKKCTDHIYRGEGRRGGQEKILKILAHNGEIPQRKLQEILNIKSGSISEILSKMEDKGLIERIRFDDDKRRTAVRITEQGLQKLREGKNNRETYDPFAALDDSEKDTLKNLLEKLLSSWKPAD